MTDKDGYFRFISDINQREMSNAESYDKSVLTFSSAFLALSLTFIKEIIPDLASSDCIWLLHLSWFAFPLAIVFTIVSYMIGQAVFSELKKGAINYFIDGDHSANQRAEMFQSLLAKLNMVHGILFVLGVSALTVFVSLNI